MNAKKILAQVFPPNESHSDLVFGRMQASYRLDMCDRFDWSKIFSSNHHEAVFLRLLFQGLAHMHRVVNSDGFDHRTDDLVMSLMELRSGSSDIGDLLNTADLTKLLAESSVAQQRPARYDITWAKLISSYRTLFLSWDDVKNFNFEDPLAYRKHQRYMHEDPLTEEKYPTEHKLTTLQALLAVDSFCLFAFRGPSWVSAETRCMLRLPDSRDCVSLVAVLLSSHPLLFTLHLCLAGS
jgi:hypothetical protein